MAGRMGIRRLAGALGLVGAAFVLGACEPDGVTFTVNVATDGRDAVPGDGVCEVTTGVGDCSLRAAIDEANVLSQHERVVIAPGVDPVLSLGPAGDDANVRGDLDITDSVTIESAGGATIDAAGLDRVFHVVGTASDATWVNLRQVTVTGGAAVQGAGASLGSDVTLNVERSTFTGNAASGTGGAFRVGSGGSLRVTNSTVSGNSAAAGAGGVFSLGSVNLTHATVTDNASTTAAVQRHGSSSGAVSVQGSIVADQAVGADCSGVVTSSGGNLSSGVSCGFTAAGDQQSTDPQLGPLAFHGGPTFTHLPALTSPAVDAIAPGIGQCGTLLVDQRGDTRPNGPGCDTGAVEADSETGQHLVVDSAADQPDANPADGVCDRNAAPALPGDCTLRAAISTSNTTPTLDTIAIAPGVDPILSIGGAEENANAAGDLDVLDGVVIDGGGATIDADGTGRVLHIDAEGVTIRDVEITGGYSLAGSGILVSPGSTVDLQRSTLRQNVATGPFIAPKGGALWASYATVTVTDSTFTDNRAVEVAASGVVTGLGGAMYLDHTATIISGSTIVDNQARFGAALTVAPPIEEGEVLPEVMVRGSIVAANTGACYLVGSAASLVSQGHNIASDASCELTQASDQPSTNPLVAVVADNGGPSPTRLPFANSPAVDAIPIGTPGLCTASTPVDQRGSVRPAGGGCDVGAVEGSSELTATPLALAVDTEIDEVDAAPGDGICDRNAPPAEPGDCSLRAAVTESNLWPTQDTITIADGVDPVITLVGAGDDSNATGDFDLTAGLVLDGSGGTVDGGDLDRVFHAHTDGVVELRDLHVSNGSADHGGGLHVEQGTVWLVDSTVQGNTASRGGGVYLQQGQLTVERSTISGNSTVGPVVDSDGGGIYQQYGQLLLRRSTVSGNTANRWGGGLRTGLAGAQATIVQTTFSANVAVTGHAVTSGGATGTISGSVIQEAGRGCYNQGAWTSTGHNIGSDAFCAFTKPTDLASTNALLGPLADNGGPTLTHLPGVGSPAIDSIPVGTVGLCDGTSPTDQRGVARPTGAACDRGSVEQ